MATKGEKAGKREKASKATPKTRKAAKPAGTTSGTTSGTTRSAATPAAAPAATPVAVSAPVTAEPVRPVATTTVTRGTTSSVPARGGTAADEITRALLLPVQVAQRVLPTHRAPVYLGAAALAVVGVLDWPLALGAGLAWEALNRWGPDPRGRG